MTGTECFCVSFKSQGNSYKYALSGDQRTVEYYSVKAGTDIVNMLFFLGDKYAGPPLKPVLHPASQDYPQKSPFLSGIDITMTDNANRLQWILLDQSMYKNPGRIQIFVLFILFILRVNVNCACIITLTSVFFVILYSLPFSST